VRAYARQRAEHDAVAKGSGACATEALSDPNDDVKCSAAEALRRLGQAKAAVAESQAYEHKVAAVRRAGPR
jgi:hypothetical protein